MNKNILIIGQGGREHAIAWKIAQSNNCEKVFVAPGNPGMKKDAKIECVDIRPNDTHKIVDFIELNKIHLVVIGPEDPLVNGLADILRANDVLVFGPGAEGAQLEASKAFSKKIMDKANIPTAKYEEFVEASKAKEFIKTCNWPDGIVVKMDGLAAGKGVVVCDNRDDALKAIDELMVNNALNLDDTRVVLEERLIGKEVSAFALIDSNNFITIGHACDYKRIRDNDEGPNTGGMGTYSPADWLTKVDITSINQDVIAPLVKQLKKNCIAYNGVIFVGLMKTAQGMKVLEFNVRFGDPETQSLLPRIKTDFLNLLTKTAKNELGSIKDIEFENKTVVHVVSAAFGYPGTEGTPVRKGDDIKVADKLINDDFSVSAKVFFAGVKEKEQQLVTNGGRVLGISAMGSSKKEARDLAYKNIQNINFEGMQFRNDIAKDH